MSKINFTFVLHNHQPLGNFDWVIEESYQKAYLPFLQTVEAYPGIRVGIHNTGILLEWFAAHHPEYLDRLRKLVDDGRVEILTGTYYEAILPSIPDADKVGQIRKLSDLIEKTFGRRPRGMWVAERVWEPGLARSLAEAGVDYVFLDDSHFKLAGIPEDDLCAHFVTEEQGSAIHVVPINQPLRHGIPFEKPDKPIDFLKAAADSGDGKWLAFADDGEKLGSWPGTYQHVYEERWLGRFFGKLLATPQIEMRLPSQALDATRSAGIAYLPTASYSEMIEWSGGFWRNFLRRYPESNWMHKRMQKLSRELPDTGPPRDEIWKAQCNCPYWHGVFGGLYLPHLRREVFSHLIDAETAAGLPKKTRITVEDLDLDGRDELIVRAPTQSLYFKPAEGGSLVEWDIHARSLNLINTLARRPESYHPELAKKAEMAEPIRYDWYSRRSFIDHFLRDGTTPETFAACAYGEQGDFVVGEYHAATNPLTLERDGGAWVGNRFCRVKVAKRFDLAPNGFRVSYTVTNREAIPLDLWFGIETNYSLSAGNAEGRYYQLPAAGAKAGPLDAVGEHFDASSIELVDEWLGIAVALELDQPSTLWHFPIETLSQSESGADRIYQSSVLFPNWRLRLEPGASWSVALQNTVRSL